MFFLVLGKIRQTSNCSNEDSKASSCNLSRHYTALNALHEFSYYTLKKYTIKWVGFKLEKFCRRLQWGLPSLLRLHTPSSPLSPYRRALASVLSLVLWPLCFLLLSYAPTPEAPCLWPPEMMVQFPKATGPECPQLFFALSSTVCCLNTNISSSHIIADLIPKQKDCLFGD